MSNGRSAEARKGARHAGGDGHSNHRPNRRATRRRLGDQPVPEEARCRAIASPRDPPSRWVGVAGVKTEAAIGAIRPSLGGPSEGPLADRTEIARLCGGAFSSYPQAAVPEQMTSIRSPACIRLRCKRTGFPRRAPGLLGRESCFNLLNRGGRPFGRLHKGPTPDFLERKPLHGRSIARRGSGQNSNPAGLGLTSRWLLLRRSIRRF